MKWFADLLNSAAIFIEREAGHNVTSMALIIFGMFLLDTQTRAQAAHDLVIFGLGVLSRSMGQTSTEENRDGNVTTPPKE